MLLTVFVSRRSFPCWVIRAALAGCPCGAVVPTTSRSAACLAMNRIYPFTFTSPSTLVYSFFLFFFHSRSNFFLQVQKGAFHFPHLREKVRKNTLSLLKGNILLLALLYVQRFLAPLILNSVHEWMDNFLPVSFFMPLNYLLPPQLVAASPLIPRWAAAVRGAPVLPLSWGKHPQRGAQAGPPPPPRTKSWSSTARIQLICLHHSYLPNPESFWLPSTAPFQSLQCPACNIVTRIAHNISNILPLMSYIK